MPQLEKVTAFVTRHVGDAAKLPVFRHGRSGIQVPAGTVEEEPPTVAGLGSKPPWARGFRSQFMPQTRPPQ